MPGTNTTVRQLLLHGTTRLELFRQASELTALPIDDLILGQHQEYAYFPGSHRVRVTETDYTEGFYMETMYIMFLNLYRHEDPKNPGLMAVEEPRCPGCGSGHVSYTYGHIFCSDCDEEYPWP